MPEVFAFSRILNDEEVVCAVNTTQQVFSLVVIVDDSLNSVGNAYQLLYSNKPAPTAPQAVQVSSAAAVIYEVDGSTSRGAVHYVLVTLQPLEAQIIGAVIL